jgi:signal transduction histidine kinase
MFGSCLGHVSILTCGLSLSLTLRLVSRSCPPLTMPPLQFPQPIPLLIRLERILLALTALAVLLTAVLQPALRASHVMLLCVAMFAIIGFKLPDRRVHQVLYVSLEFFLFLLPVLAENRTRFVFILGLVIVLRSGQMFHQRDRYFIAAVDFVLFILMVLLRERSFHSDSEFSSALMMRYLLDQFHNILAFGLSLMLVLLLTESLLEVQFAHQQLRQYALQIENHAILQERSRIAHDIHDAIGHTLAAQSIQLASGMTLLSTEPAQAAVFFTQARQLCAQALQDIRTSVSALKVDPLNGQNLDTAIAVLLQDFQQTTPISVEYRLADLSQIDGINPAINLALYRILQEALTNIARHSRATTVLVQLFTQQDWLYLLVRDDGQGFTPGVGGIGFQSMNERAIALKGQWSIISEPGAGCLITVKIPLVHDDSVTFS